MEETCARANVCVEDALKIHPNRRSMMVRKSSGLHSLGHFQLVISAYMFEAEYSIGLCAVTALCRSELLAGQLCRPANKIMESRVTGRISRNVHLAR